MILEEEYGIRLKLDRYLGGLHRIEVSGAGVDRRVWRGYQNMAEAFDYYRQCVERRKKCTTAD